MYSYILLVKKSVTERNLQKNSHPEILIVQSNILYKRNILEKGSEKDHLTFIIYEPLSSLQVLNLINKKFIGEPLEHCDLLTKEYDVSAELTHLLSSTAFGVGTLSSAIEGRYFKLLFRIFPPVYSYLGETFEYIEPEKKIISISENVKNNLSDFPRSTYSNGN